MSKYLGFSTNCFPEKTAEEILSYLKKLKCNTLDLRIGKGQKWEEKGCSYFTENGVRIAFIGLDLVLGKRFFTKELIKDLLTPYENLNIKILAHKSCMNEYNRGYTIQQVSAIKNNITDKKILVESHHGYADIDTLLKLHQETGVNILLDIMGFFKICNDIENVSIIRLKKAVKAIQIKGFDWHDPINSRHLPLDKIDLSPLKKILEEFDNPSMPITIETRSNSYEEDYLITKQLLNQIKT
ncbi:hypothetical protein QNH18_01180 [Bacillus paralicheniformis]|uniref:hypothetical protein n=1 Tax=Bacillus paralicheniformis TaxID=1648923 RepID=UPI0024C1857A|nr:hypothetical protein [Bacillus paralicheniformis]WHX86981.1 hypothetical protein QNH18_01180 [Bacillus paralicheniformis]